MTVQPARPRFSIDDDGSSLRLTIPSRKHWFQIIFTSVWLILWLFFAVNVAGLLIGGVIGLINSPAGSAGLAGVLVPGAFGLLWISVWIGVGLFVLYSFLLQVIGSEIVEVSRQSMSIRRKVVGIEKPKTYDASYIKDLRAGPDLSSSFWPGGYGRSFLRRNTGTLAFDYGAKTIRFGDMDEAEAKMVLAEILRRYPDYGRA